MTMINETPKVVQLEQMLILEVYRASVLESRLETAQLMYRKLQADLSAERRRYELARAQHYALAAELEAVKGNLV